MHALAFLAARPGLTSASLPCEKLTSRLLPLIGCGALLWADVMSADTSPLKRGGSCGHQQLQVTCSMLLRTGWISEYTSVSCFWGHSPEVQVADFMKESLDASMRNLRGQKARKARLTASIDAVIIRHVHMLFISTSQYP